MRSTAARERGDWTALTSLAALALLCSAPAWAASIGVEAPSASPGDTVTIQFLLRDAGADVASLSIDVGFPPGAPIAAGRQSRPDCRPREEIQKANSAFTFRPAGCVPGVDCTSLRAGIISFDPDTTRLPIPDGPVFSCTLAVPAQVPIGERIPIDVLRASAIAPDNQETDVTQASTGDFVDVVARPPCAGDCDRDGRVGIGELTRAVAIGLGVRQETECAGLDLDRQGGVSADEVIAAEINAGIGCPSASRPR